MGVHEERGEDGDGDGVWGYGLGIMGIGVVAFIVLSINLAFIHFIYGRCGMEWSGTECSNSAFSLSFSFFSFFFCFVLGELPIILASPRRFSSSSSSSSSSL